jgi:hypothetical protein
MHRPVHTNVTCCECGIKNFCGWRYKCANCPDYDICAACFPYTTHDEHHAFLILRKACQFSPQERTKPLLEESLYRRRSPSQSNNNYNATLTHPTFYFPTLPTTTPPQPQQPIHFIPFTQVSNTDVCMDGT